MSDENNKRAFIKNILVVEDDYFSSVIYNSMLNGLGFNMIGPAHTTEEALEIIDQQSFDVAILDVNLEGQMVTPVVEKL